MKPIYGTIAARRKDRPGKGGKVSPIKTKKSFFFALLVLGSIAFDCSFFGPPFGFFDLTVVILFWFVIFMPLGDSFPVYLGKHICSLKNEILISSKKGFFFIFIY